MKSILVIGGGLIGAASALKLQAAGLETRLIDPGDKRRGASFGNAGHIGAEQVMPWSTWPNLIGAPAHLFGFGGPLDFRMRDVARWLPWSLRFMAASDPKRVAASHAALTALLYDAMGAWRRLEILADMPGMVRPHGQANLFMSAEAGEKAREAWARTPIGACSYREMSGDELARYDAVLRQRPASGLHFDGTGQVCDPQGARDGVLAKFAALGGVTLADSAAYLDASGSVVTQSGKQFQADALLIACGAWSAPLMRQFGVRAPIIGERGYSMQSLEHNWPEDLPTTIFEERSVVFSRFASGLRTTSFLEFGDPNAAPDPRKWTRLQRHVDELGVQFSTTPDRWVGPRPTLPDYVPAIGRLKSASKVLYAFGHAHLGLTECAITAEIIEALLTDKPPPFDLSPFAIERFN